MQTSASRGEERREEERKGEEGRGEERRGGREEDRKASSSGRNFPDVTKRKRKSRNWKLPNKVNDKGRAADARWQLLLPPLLFHLIIQPANI